MSGTTWRDAEARVLHLNRKRVPAGVIVELTGLTLPGVERIIREAA